jgi:3-hydroxyacyl-[acyl-carrier-protein] dehydratase
MNRQAEGRASILELGPDVIQHLLPHRRPLLMVDTIRRYERGADGGRPELWARRQISANEEVFAGHYPGLHLWPGIYTIEGLGQSCFLLEILVMLQKAYEDGGGNADEVLAALRNLELGYQLNPRYRPEQSALLERLGQLGGRVGISASVEMRFLQPVFAGQGLDYHVVRTHVVERFMRYEVEASVDGRPVARGFITGALGERPGSGPPVAR